ncbi:MAG TPA: dipeptidase [Ktedonobacterales bacterium]
MLDATRLPIFDGHNDVLLNLYLPERGGGRSFFERSERGHIDLPRARDGGFAGGFFAAFVPNARGDDAPEKPEPEFTENGYMFPLAEAIDRTYAQRVAIGLTALLYRLEEESRGQVKVVRSAAEMESCLRDGTLAAVLHFEGAEAIDPELDYLYLFHAAGLRSLGLVWSRPNAFGCGVPFAFPRTPDTGPGLTDAGRELVRACNRLRIMLDLSHLNERGFWDVAELTNAPLVVTHACAHAISPTSRNLTDRQLDAVGESDGIVGVNFNVGFIREDGMPNADTPLTQIVRHVDYIANRIGIDRVAFGSDFDGATMPRELGDVAGLPTLVTALRAAGYDDAALRKIAYENWLRVLRKTWGR